MLGGLEFSWETYLGLRHGRISADMFSPGKVDLPFAELQQDGKDGDA